VLPGLCSGGKTEFTHDVIVIKSLEALPNRVAPGQQIKLQSYIENRGNKKVDNIEVVLYDTCGLFTKIEPECPPDSAPSKEGVGCSIDLLPLQTKPISWNLVSDKDIRILSRCDLKIYARYNYITESVTSITLIDYKEYQKLLDEGKLKTRSSYITEGYGPVKPYLTVEEQQPVPVGKEGGIITLGFQVKNRGSGFLSQGNKIEFIWDNDCDLNTGTICMKATKIGSYDIINNAGKGEGNVYSGLKECLEKHFQKDGKGGEIALIKGESPKIICPIPLPKEKQVNLPKESTIHVTTAIRYTYEFRKEVRVTVEPKI